MMLPDEIRDQIRERLWQIADEAGWSHLSDVDRARYYEIWTRDPGIGGRLGHFMDPRKVRVYIKDSLLKSYERDKLSETEHAVMRLLGLGGDSVVQAYIKPHGRRFADGCVACWGKSRDWKLILVAAFERAYEADASSRAVVLIETGKTASESSRFMVRQVAKRLGIERMEWLE